MRLLSLEISGFRGFSETKRFDLNADAIILVGANGNGKTSLFDAILWALSGRIPRIGTNDGLLVSKYSPSETARVELEIGDAKGTQPVTVTRTFDGQQAKLLLHKGNASYVGPQAEGILIDLLWKDAASSANPLDSLASLLTRCLYLQQDLIRQFLDSVTDNERFIAVSELIGAGRVSELQSTLEKDKAAWTRTTNSKSAELQPLRMRLANLESRLSELKERQTIVSVQISDTEWHSWVANLKSVGIELTSHSIGDRETPSAIDNAMNKLDTLRRASERKQGIIESVLQDRLSLSQLRITNIDSIEAEVTRLNKAIEEKRAEIKVEQEKNAEFRRLQVTIKEKSEQLRALATLALNHLDDLCPVCQQSYDKVATVRRLQDLVTSKPEETTGPPANNIIDVLVDQLREFENELSATAMELRTQQHVRNEHMTLTQSILKRCEEIGTGSSDISEVEELLKVKRASVSREINIVEALQKAGESIALRLSLAQDQALISELETEIEENAAKLKTEETIIQHRVVTGERAQKVIESLRKASTEVVSEKVREIEPVLKDMYNRIDVHPTFREVKLLASMYGGHGKLSAAIKDPVYNLDCPSPPAVLSSSQLNALAVCAFLSMNLSAASLPLKSVLLDDPLQSLDDINLLGLLDLLRRIKDKRQLVITTHDARFGKLMERKLRPQSSSQRTVVIELEGWSRSGPSVYSYDVKCDPAPLRLSGSSETKNDGIRP